jgi:hypothetical protein
MQQNNFLKLFSKYRILIYVILILLIVGFVGFQLIDSFVSPLPFISLSQVHLAVLLLVNLFLFHISFDIYNHSQSGKRKIVAWQLSFVIILLNFVAVYLFADFYASRSNYPLVATLLTFVPAGEVILTLGGLLCFWKGFGDHLIWVWNSFSFSEGKDESASRKWVTLAVLAMAFAVGIGLRLINLANYPAYVDEYTHIHAAADMLGGAPLTWDRAFLTVNLPVYLSYRVFGLSLWASRFPMVLINMLAIFPLYFLAKKINHWVGYISVILFVVSPWGIAVAHTVRDYAIVPVFFYLAALLLLDLLDWEGLSIKQYLNRNKFRMGAALLILIYAVVDVLSILKIVVVVYAIFGALAILKIWKTKPSLWFKVAAICTGVASIIFAAIYSGLLVRFFVRGLFVYQMDLTSWNSLVSNNVRQWYVFGGISYLFIVFGVFFVLRSIFARYRKSDFVFLMCYTACAAILFYLVFFLVNPYIPTRARYGILMEYWYLIVVAVVLYTGFYAVQRKFGKRYLAIPVVIVVALFFNYQSYNAIFTYQGGGIFQLTGEHHYIVDPAYNYLTEHLTDKDVLMTDVMAYYDMISGHQFGDVKIINFHSDDPLNVIKEYPQGYIAVTAAFHPEKTNLQFTDSDYAGKQVHYLGLVGEVYMWQWGGAAPH